MWGSARSSADVQRRAPVAGNTRVLPRAGGRKRRSVSSCPTPTRSNAPGARHSRDATRSSYTLGAGPRTGTASSRSILIPAEPAMRARGAAGLTTAAARACGCPTEGPGAAQPPPIPPPPKPDGDWFCWRRASASELGGPPRGRLRVVALAAHGALGFALGTRGLTLGPRESAARGSLLPATCGRASLPPRIAFGITVTPHGVRIQRITGRGPRMAAQPGRRTWLTHPSA